MVSRQRDALAGAAMDRQGRRHDRRRLARPGSAPWVRRVTGSRGTCRGLEGRHFARAAQERPWQRSETRADSNSPTRSSKFCSRKRLARRRPFQALQRHWRPVLGCSVGVPSRPPVWRALSAPWSSPAPDGRTGRHDVVVRPCPIQTARFTFKERSSAVLFKSVYRLARSR